MAESQQVTFGKVRVNSMTDFTTDTKRCDGIIEWQGDEPQRCTNNAAIAIMREPNGIPEFYCLSCSRDEWIRMAGVSGDSDSVEPSTM